MYKGEGEVKAEILSGLQMIQDDEECWKILQSQKNMLGKWTSADCQEKMVYSSK